MKILLAIIGFFVGALIAYLACVWLSGYFYDPFVPSPNMFDGTSGTRYVMMVGAVAGMVITPAWWGE